MSVGGATATAPADTCAWRLRGSRFDLSRPLVAGILNLTPDSFSDGGLHLDPAVALDRAHELVDQGADLLDIGGESSRPGAEPVDARTEWRRLEPVLTRLDGLSIPISVDTTKLEVARAALACGAAAINDITGLRAEPGLADLAAESGAGLILMHMRGNPRTMQRDVAYADLIGEVRAALAASIGTAVARGCDPSQLVVDPGIGFGKSAAGNLELLARLEELSGLGRPLLVGPSRKSFIGAVLNVPVDQRVEGTVAACVLALERGARIFRVHDVREVRRSLDLAHAIRRAGAASEGPDGRSAGTARAGRPPAPATCR